MSALITNKLWGCVRDLGWEKWDGQTGIDAEDSDGGGVSCSHSRSDHRIDIYTNSIYRAKASHQEWRQA